jgi:CRP/FNR family nitrogen fixation transcriptional regulator
MDHRNAETAMQTLQANINSGCGPARPAAVPVELVEGLVLPGSSVRYDRNEEIFAQEDDADFVYQVISGAVREVRILDDGRRQVSAFHLPGEVFGLECGETHLNFAEAVVASEVALVRRSVLVRAIEADAPAARKLWNMTSRDLLRLQDHLLLLGRKSATERVISFLLRMSARWGTAAKVDLPMSRLDIADHLGLTIETVSRTFTQLERDGAISIPSARHIVLHDRIALQRQ